MSQPQNAAKPSELLDDMVEEADGDRVSLGELLQTFESRSFGPLLLLLGAIAISPIGAIPGMSIVTGSLIILLAGQLLLGRKHPWFPQRILRWKISRARLARTAEWLRPWAKWTERFVHERLTILASGPAEYLVPAVAILLAVSFFPLALVPWGVAAPAAAVVLFGLGLTVRDGALTIGGLLFTALAAVLCWYFWPF